VTNKDDFAKKLLETFRIEAEEHLDAMSLGLIELEKNPQGERRIEIVEKIFREAHSLKGASRAVNLTDIESVCHALENMFAGLKAGRVAISLQLFDLLQQALGVIEKLLVPESALKITGRKPEAASLIRKLEEAQNSHIVPLNEEEGTKPQSWDAALPAAPQSLDEIALDGRSGDVTTNTGPSIGTIRIHKAKLDAVLRQAEELLGPRLAAGQHANELCESRLMLMAWKKERASVQPAFRSVERNLSHLLTTGSIGKEQRELAKLLEYLESDYLLLKSIEERLAKLEKSAEQYHRELSGMVDSLLQEVKEMQMLPFSSLLEAFPRFARDLASSQHKRVELTIQGGAVQIDRRILEELKDPLNHLLRNCIDHGIEEPALREQKGKTPQGKINITVFQKDSSKVEIIVADDGTGIDLSKVRSVAEKQGLVSAEDLEQLGEKDLLSLLFRSGFSTSPIVTDISGRGLGLAIVREKVEQLRGTIDIEMAPDVGVSFHIMLPLSLATFRGVLIRTGNQIFTIQTTSVELVARVARNEVQMVENRETILNNGQAVSLVHLSDILELAKPNEDIGENIQVVILRSGLDRIAFRVDSVLGEQEVLVKGLGSQLIRVRNVAGACVLGTGQVVQVLNVPDLIKSAKITASEHVKVSVQPTAHIERKSILVVEDSITSRALLKNILESAGYKVATAVDGVDAYSTLKTGSFDLVVSDVEMPRLDGFGLTAKIRADKKLSELPVVLVTALGSREHRERGIDVGANAYIVKSSFDQSNLLEVVSTLI
jgi:two-component system chemotaxis sensor kinase CheA